MYLNSQNNFEEFVFSFLASYQRRVCVRASNFVPINPKLVPLLLSARVRARADLSSREMLPTEREQSERLNYVRRLPALRAQFKAARRNDAGLRRGRLR